MSGPISRHLTGVSPAGRHAVNRPQVVIHKEGTGAHTETLRHTARTVLVRPTTTGGVTLTLPSPGECTGVFIVIHTLPAETNRVWGKTNALVVTADGSTALSTLTGVDGSVTFYSDGYKWMLLFA